MDYTSGSNALVIASDNLTKSQIVEPFTNLHEELKDFDLKNFTIFDGFTKAYSVINNSKYKNMICAISGGSDSDIVLDIIYRCDISKKVRYIWINTGLEYQATKDHIKFLEEKYSITIEQLRGMPIPLAVRKYGLPFCSKQASVYIQRLQHHDFKWEDQPFEQLLKEYPNCKSALEWWCNKKPIPRLNISWNKWLKEFLIACPPDFAISDQCCKVVKKEIIHTVEKESGCDLDINGVRKAEGGVRATAYHSCFDFGKNVDTYRPVFWYKKDDKLDYEETFNVTHSDCYCKYGLPRTGCACCPFGQCFEEELEACRKYEPNLYTAANNIFGKSYDYTRKYRRFKEEMNSIVKSIKSN